MFLLQGNKLIDPSYNDVNHEEDKGDLKEDKNDRETHDDFGFNVRIW